MATNDDIIKALKKLIDEAGGGTTTTSSEFTKKKKGETDEQLKARRNKARLEQARERGRELAHIKKMEEAGARLVDREERLLKLRQEKLDLDMETRAITAAEAVNRQKSIDAELAGLKDGNSLMKSMLGITNEQGTTLSKAVAGGTDFMKGQAKAVKQLVSGKGALNVLTASIDKVVQASIALAMAQDASVVNFRRQTGASGQLDSTIMNLEQSMYTAGVSSEEASQAIQSLYLNVTDFTAMSPANQEELGKTVAVLNELGVSSETSAKNMQFAIKVLGQSTKQAAKLQRELFVFAQGLGVSVDQMASDFASMGPQIAALGSNGEAAFKRLQIQAKNTGLALSELLGLVEKFDTFDSAAQSVGKLNALLGGPYLNTLELVATTDPSERFRILKERIDDAGVSFDDMDYYQRKALASAMGLNEQQLALLTRGSLDQIMPKPKSAADIESLAKQTAEFNTMMEELGQIGRGFAVSLAPIVSVIKKVVQAMQDFEIGGVNGIQMLIGLGIAAATFAASGVIGPIAATAGFITALVVAFQGLVHSLTVGNSPSVIEAFSMFGEAIANVSSFLSPLMSIMSPITGMFADMSHGATDLADSMSLIPSEKSASFVSTVKQTADAAETVNQTAFASTAATIGAQAAAPAPAATQASGPPPVININLSIDGTEFAAVVNSVAVESYSGGKPSDLHNSIAHMIEQGLMTGRRGI
tara:strand:- start:1288 stop:3399 length:2112 start_codon:yes stop_codon:yes gene_type:complete